MEHIDRLTTLLERFRLKVDRAPLDTANLAGFSSPDSDGTRLILQPGNDGIRAADGELLFALSVDFGGPESPLRTALPRSVVEDARQCDVMDNIAALLAVEYGAPRCGSPVVMARLGEVLVVQVLRAQIERGTASSGLLAGLAHPRIGAAIVAIHDAPERPWRNADLAEVAGLSASRFKEVFANTVGDTPGGYMRHWRLTLARRDLERGDRVDRVAHRYGYGAPDAFSRAFQRQFGERPRQAIKARQQLTAPAPAVGQTDLPVAMG